MVCPFCSQSYASATGLTHHLGVGSCPNARNINRDEVYKLVRSRDPNGMISKKLIGWTGSSVFEATEFAYNGYTGYYECYLCNREFTTIHGLNQHLNSPIRTFQAHPFLAAMAFRADCLVDQQELYHCPNLSCRQDFKSLAGLFNHLESESCGAMRFETVQKSMNTLISSNRRLEF